MPVKSEGSQHQVTMLTKPTFNVNEVQNIYFAKTQEQFFNRPPVEKEVVDM